jgi:hypothetical protein
LKIENGSKTDGAPRGEVNDTIHFHRYA